MPKKKKGGPKDTVNTLDQDDEPCGSDEVQNPNVPEDIRIGPPSRRRRLDGQKLNDAKKIIASSTHGGDDGSNPSQAQASLNTTSHKKRSRDDVGNEGQRKKKRAARETRLSETNKDQQQEDTAQRDNRKGRDMVVDEDIPVACDSDTAMNDVVEEDSVNAPAQNNGDGGDAGNNEVARRSVSKERTEGGAPEGREERVDEENPGRTSKRRRAASRADRGSE
ncbi:hypothetical protein NLJ89_g8318 [Agrocybe chaxingu]|uniref:Uncharacterized protein n=1 Tax=Agrocybe chaxingu TaxID=84603 RepID=A0A9W8MS94_9AGAR|nr:hypothetical protein NLJ89_g8318 [Agrocybe chaxingu]